VNVPDKLGIIAGNGAYPQLVADAARVAGVKSICAAAFENETDPALAARVNQVAWLRVGQLNRLLKFFRDQQVHHAIMAGQIAPKNLFDLRPDWKALLLLARLKERNAETIFAAIADELAKAGVELLPATSFLENHLAGEGLLAGPKLSRREQTDVEYGWKIAREIARLDIGQSVVVKGGTVLAVEGFDGTNETIRRGGKLAGEGAVLVKVAKANQDMRFDVPVIGAETIRIAAAAKLRVVAVEAGRTLFLAKETMADLAEQAKISLVGRATEEGDQR
jgi:hypothetical protein